MIDKYLDLAWEPKKLTMKVTVIPVEVGAHGTVTKSLENRLGELEIRRRVFPDYRDRIDYCHGGLKRFAVTQTPVKDSYLKQEWNTCKE